MTLYKYSLYVCEGIIDTWLQMCWVQSAADALVAAHVDARRGLWAHASWRFVDLNDALRSAEAHYLEPRTQPPDDLVPSYI